MSITTNEENQKPGRPKSLMALAIVIPVLLGVVWMNRGSGPTETPTKIPPRVPSQSASPTPGETPAPGGETPRRAVLKEFTVFLPTEDGKLAKKMVAAPKIPSSQKNVGPPRGMWIDLALGDLFSEGSAYFPIGSHPIAPTKTEADVVTVDLNKAYLANAEAWSSAEVTSRVMSIVNTAAATDQQVTGQPAKVRLLVEGKPLSTLGEFDASDPISPDYQPVPAL